VKKSLLLIFVFVSSIFASSINIAVAANVSYAIDELKDEFRKTHPNTLVKVTLGSSGKLTAQIKNKAPYGLFMSANMSYPNTLYKEKIALTKPKVYAQGILAFFSVRQRDFSKGIKLLEDKNIRRIAVANPKTAPYGIAAKEALINAKIYNKIKNKFIYGESISQTISYAINAADIGVVAKSSLYSYKMRRFKEHKNWITLDTKLYSPIKQGIVLLKDEKAYREFYEFILSKKAKKIFEKYGYII
jgi:molybdate transport system substrate-binding protein